MSEPLTIRLVTGILVALAVATFAGSVLALRRRSGRAAAAVSALNARIRIWWGLALVFTVSAKTGNAGSMIVFGLASFLLLREFLTVAPTRRADHRALTWVFFVVLPLQYVLLGVGWYGLFIILVPVYAFLFVPIRMALAGDARSFLERAAKIQWAMMICIYCVSHAPALVRLPVEGDPETSVRLLYYLVLVVQATDLARAAGGSVAGLAAAVAAGLALAWATPFTLAESAGVAALIGVFAVGGALCHEAIVRDRGRPGVVVVGSHPTWTGRVISLCFAAPVFFHVTRFFFVPGPLSGF